MRSYSQSRRHFLQLAGAGAAISLASRSGIARDHAPTEKQPNKSSPKRAYQLGLASYTFAKFPLDRALEMTARVGLKHFCLNPALFLPMDSTADKVVHVVTKIRAAGLHMYGCGVVSMQKPIDVERAFEFAKRLGVKTIVAKPLPELLPLVNAKVQEYDTRIAIHNHGPGDKVYPTPDVAYEKIKNLDRRMGLCIDIGHTARSGIDPSRAAKEFADRLLDVHMKDINQAGNDIEIGRGVINIPRFLHTLNRIGYVAWCPSSRRRMPTIRCRRWLSRSAMSRACWR